MHVCMCCVWQFISLDWLMSAWSLHLFGEEGARRTVIENHLNTNHLAQCISNLNRPLYVLYALRMSQLN